MSDLVTVEQVARALPPNLRTAATQSLADKLNQVDSDPVIAAAIRENFISYTHVLKEGRFKAGDYLNAVKFVSFKLMGLTNDDAYFKTFPDRYEALLQEGKDPSPYVAMYKKGKLVNLILEQTLVPSWVLNQDVYQKAINVQAELMLFAKSEMVRSQAANSILVHLQKPEKAGPLVNIDARDTAGVTELRGLLQELAAKQISAIQQGIPTKEIAEQRLVETTARKVDE